MRKINKTTLKKKMDKLFAEKVRKIGFCQRCGKTSNLQCAHIYSRKNLCIRWNMENAVCLCAGCHLFWAHQEPIEFTNWVRDFKDIKHLENKIANAQPMKLFDLEVIYDSLRTNN